MSIKGVNFIGFSEGSEGTQTFNSFNPGLNQHLPGDFKLASDAEFEKAISLAGEAFDS